MRDDLSFDSIRIGVLRFLKIRHWTFFLFHFCKVIFNMICYFFMIDALSFLAQFIELFVLKKRADRFGMHLNC